MKFCENCGYQLVDEARFCNSCGTPVGTQKADAYSEASNPYNAEPVYGANEYCAQDTQSPKTQEEMRAEEQACLDKINIGLKHEILCWRIVGIVFLVYSALSIIVGLAANDSTSAINMVTGILYLPIGIINMVMAGKVSGYRQKLYTDCKNGVGHYSVGTIVFCALFNTVALIFNIIYFVHVKNNKAVYDRIKTNQDAYNSQQ